jgi:hypothetical protein
VIRHLALTVAGRPLAEISIPGHPSPPLDAIERVLQKIMTTLVARPVEAARLTVERSGAFVLAGAGTRPVRLALLATMRGTLVLLDRRGGVLGTRPVAPPGNAEWTLAPGEERRIPVPVPDPGRRLLSGGLEFDLHVDGRARRVSVQAMPVRTG